MTLLLVFGFLLMSLGEGFVVYGIVGLTGPVVQLLPGFINPSTHRVTPFADPTFRIVVGVILLAAGAVMAFLAYRTRMKKAKTRGMPFLNQLPYIIPTITWVCNPFATF